MNWWVQLQPAATSGFPFGAAILCAGTILLWVTGRLPEYLVALGFFALAMGFALAPAEVIFAGFSSAAFWLIVAGFVLGAAIRKTGLAARAARPLASTFGGSYPKLVAGVVALTYALAFVMPSNMGRIALLMPIVLAMADRVGLSPTGRGRIGLALAVGFGTFQLGATILPSNVPNLVMAGALEASYGVRLAYLPYLVLHAPVLGVLKAVALTVVICLLFPDRSAGAPPREPPTPWTRDEKRLAGLLAVTLALWVTDTLHGIQPAWIGLGAACLCLLPRVGFVSNEEFARDVNFRVAIYVAGVLGLAAVVSRSGLGNRLGEALLAIAPLDPAHQALSFFSLFGISSLLNFALTANGTPALYTPLAGTLAEASGFPLLTVVMIQVLGYSTTILPYQAAPIVVAMELGRVAPSAGLKLCLALGAVTVLVLVPLDYLWFRATGWLP